MSKNGMDLLVRLTLLKKQQTPKQITQDKFTFAKKSTTRATDRLHTGSLKGEKPQEMF